MIPERELLRRFDRELRRFRDEMSHFGKGIYQGIKLCAAKTKELEAETQKHLTDNPKAIGALWANYRRWQKRKTA